MYEKVSEDYFKKVEAKIEVKEEKQDSQNEIRSEENLIEEPRIFITNDVDTKERQQKLVIIFGLVLIIFGLLLVKF